MENKKNTKYTKEGYDALVTELEYLKGEKTEDIKKALAFARSLGDFSENSELDAAKDEQGQVAARIAELEELLKHADIVKEDEMRDDVVNLGSSVKVYEEEEEAEEEEEVEYDIVGTNQADPMRGKISDISPIGSALIGKTVGDVVSVATPNGETKLKILSVERTKAN